MTYNSIYEKFMIEYDKANITSSYPSLTEYEIATILDKAYLALIALKVTGNNPRKAPFEYDVKAIEDIRPLITTTVVKEDKDAGRQSINELIFNIPNQLLYFLQGTLKRTKSLSSIDNKSHSLLNVKLIPHSVAQNFMATDNNLPWIDTPVCFMEDGLFHILIDPYKLKDDDITDANVTYIKKPISFVQSLLESEGGSDDDTPGGNDTPGGGNETPSTPTPPAIGGEGQGGNNPSTPEYPKVIGYSCSTQTKTVSYDTTSVKIDFSIYKTILNSSDYSDVTSEFYKTVSKTVTISVNDGNARTIKKSFTESIDEHVVQLECYIYQDSKPSSSYTYTYEQCNTPVVYDAYGSTTVQFKERRSDGYETIITITVPYAALVEGEHTMNYTYTTPSGNKVNLHPKIKYVSSSSPSTPDDPADPNKNLVSVNITNLSDLDLSERSKLYIGFTSEHLTSVYAKSRFEYSNGEIKDEDQEGWLPKPIINGNTVLYDYGSKYSIAYNFILEYFDDDKQIVVRKNTDINQLNGTANYYENLSFNEITPAYRIKQFTVFDTYKYFTKDEILQPFFWMDDPSELLYVKAGISAVTIKRTVNGITEYDTIERPTYCRVMYPDNVVEVYYGFVNGNIINNLKTNFKSTIDELFANGNLIPVKNPDERSSGTRTAIYKTLNPNDTFIMLTKQGCNLVKGLNFQLPNYVSIYPLYKSNRDCWVNVLNIPSSNYYDYRNNEDNGEYVINHDNYPNIVDQVDDFDGGKYERYGGTYNVCAVYGMDSKNETVSITYY